MDVVTGGAFVESEETSDEAEAAAVVATPAVAVVAVGGSGGVVGAGTPEEVPRAEPEFAFAPPHDPAASIK